MTARDINPRTFAEKLDKGAFPAEVTKLAGCKYGSLVAILPSNMQSLSENENSSEGKQNQESKTCLHDIISYLATAVSEVLSSYP